MPLNLNKKEKKGRQETLKQLLSESEAKLLNLGYNISTLNFKTLHINYSNLS